MAAYQLIFFRIRLSVAPKSAIVFKQFEAGAFIGKRVVAPDDVSDVLAR